MQAEIFELLFNSAEIAKFTAAEKVKDNMSSRIKVDIHKN